MGNSASRARPNTDKGSSESRPDTDTTSSSTSTPNRLDLSNFSVSTSDNVKFLAEQISSCNKSIHYLKKASQARTDLAETQKDFNDCHLDLAKTIKTFIESQLKPSPSETQQDNEDDSVNEGALIPYLLNNESRDLWKALEGVQEQFRKAHESGKDVSRELEVDYILKQEKQPSILVRAMSLQRSSSRRVSCSTFYNSEEMGIILENLKILEELRLKHLKDTKKTKPKRQKPQDASSEKLNVKCGVAKRDADTKEEEISKLKMEHLLPKLGKQLRALEANWSAMSVCHEIQICILSQVGESPNQPLQCEESHQNATKELKKQLRKWSKRFKSYVTLQKNYVESICFWLQEKGTILGVNDGDCSINLNELESNAKVVNAEMRKFRIENVAALSRQQKIEHDYRRWQVKKLEDRIINKTNRLGDVNEKQCLEKEVEELKERIESNKETLQREIEKTEKMVNQFRTGFLSVCEKLKNYSSKAADTFAEIMKHLPCTTRDVHR